MNVSNVEGLTILEKPPVRDKLEGTLFALPADFPTEKYAAKWEEIGNPVVQAQQQEYISSLNAMADGWQIYKVLKNPRKILTPDQQAELSEEKLKDYKKYNPILEQVERKARKTTLVLMFRPKVLQKALNIAYANESRTLVAGEVDGDKQSVTDDPGILTNRDLRKHFNSEGEEDMGYLKTTPLANATEAATLVV